MSKQPKSRHEQIVARFRKFHARNPKVWELFQQFTLEKIAAGHEHYSAAGIIHHIRWETPVGEVESDAFKVNDHYGPLYARWFEQKHPEHKGFFRSRKLSSKDAPASALTEFKPSDIKTDPQS